MVVQAVPSVSPGKAAKYVRKMECFCFERQKLEAHAERNMPLRFELSPDIPEHIGQITLSYTLFDAGNFTVN
jgi:cytochrome c oxidase assembly protein subunit 11